MPKTGVRPCHAPQLFERRKTVLYQALYRKWRPQTFSDVVGQEHITETLRRQIENGRLSHAYLFVGTRGTGKTTCAKILAKAANCEHPVNGNPCNECASCRGINSGAILDVEELDAASNNGVDNIRALRDEAVYSPASVRKRVYIIDEVHMLSTSAFNALLKILEEPPEHLIFILATTELHKVPATILSRCQRFSFKRITPQDTAKRLKFVANEEKLDLTDDGAEMLSVLAEGSLRDALSLLDQCASPQTIDRQRVLSVFGLAGAYETAELMKMLLKGDITNALSTLSRLYADGREMSAILSELMSLYRDTLVYKVTKGKNGELFAGRNDIKTVREIASSADTKRLIRGVSAIEHTLSDLAKSTDIRTETELCIIKLADDTLMPELAGLDARIARLEAGGVIAVPKASAEAPKTVAATPVNDDLISAPFDTKGAEVITPARQKPIPEAKPEPKAPEIPKASDEPEKVKADAPSQSGEGTQWKAIVSALSGKIGHSAYTFLSNEMHSYGEISEREVYVAVKSAIAKRLLDSTEVKLAIKDAAERILGRPVSVNVGDERKTDNTQTEDKLSSLSRFGNIKFE